MRRHSYHTSSGLITKIEPAKNLTSGANAADRTWHAVLCYLAVCADWCRDVLCVDTETASSQCINHSRM